MKNLIKATTLAAVMGLSANAMAADASGSFQWSGKIPEANTSNGFKIVNNGSVNHDSGMLLFKTSENGEIHNLTGSDELIFGVVTDAGDVVQSFKYELNSFDFAAGGTLARSVDGQFKLHADGKELATKTSITKSEDDSTSNVHLTIENGTGLSSDTVTGGSTVVVMATILVSDV